LAAVTYTGSFNHLIMPKKPFVHLILPQLFQPLKLWNKGYKFEVKSNYLTKLLQSYHIEQQHSVGITASLFSSIGLSTKEELFINCDNHNISAICVASISCL